MQWKLEIIFFNAKGKNYLTYIAFAVWGPEEICAVQNASLSND